MYQFGRKRGEAIEFSVSMSIVNDNVFPLDVFKLAQTLEECLAAGRVSGKGGRTEVSNQGDLRWLLRLGHSPGHHEHESDYRKPCPF